MSRKVDPCGPMTLDNLSLHYNLMDSWDLTVFFLVPLLVELAGVPAVHALVRCQAAIKVNLPKITNVFNSQGKLLWRSRLRVAGGLRRSRLRVARGSCDPHLDRRRPPAK